MIKILTHRGLDPAKRKYYLESSAEAFADQLKRGFGLELDLQFTKDRDIVVLHDGNLNRLSGQKINKEISALTIKEVLRITIKGCHFTSLDSLLRLIASQKKQPTCAIHVKYSWQKPVYLSILLEKLKKFDQNKFIIFDIQLPAAKYLNSRNPKMLLAPSVVHPFDAERYNRCVGGTLMTVADVIRFSKYFDYVWLDEWDRADKNHGIKALYTKDIFHLLRKQGLGIALVSPELHKSSPGLLGGESHPDAKNSRVLAKRIEEIINLKPDFICTDYPDEVKKML